MNRSELAARLKVYTTPYPEEESFAASFIELLRQPDSFLRSHFHPGHFTASAWVVNAGGSHTLLLKHAKLNRWLQPGGHADGDPDVRAVALRELCEETGLTGVPDVDAFFDLDIHRIPARKTDPAHNHYDFRFLVRVDDRLPVQSNHESTEVRWIALNELEHVNPDASLLRLRAKTHDFASLQRR